MASVESDRIHAMGIIGESTVDVADHAGVSDMSPQDVAKSRKVRIGEQALTKMRKGIGVAASIVDVMLEDSVVSRGHSTGR